jgi:uncharacterized protein YndB with AHSA1/START domain
MSTVTPVPGRRRVKKRLLIPVLVLGLLLVLLAWLYLRGTWADTTARDPQSAAAGPITQLYRTPEGDVVVRSAIRFDAPPAKVWEVIQDYPSHPQFLPYVSAMEARPEAGGRVYVTGTVHSRLWGDWPFAAYVDHKKISDGEFVATWDEPGEGLAVNRGSWMVRAVERDKTLVVYTLQAETARYPNFFVRNLLLNRLGALLSGLRDEVNRRQAGS